MRWLAIANPAAGRTHEAERMVNRLGSIPAVDVEVVRTRAPGDASRLALDARAFDGVIAIGGDGTIAEVLQGMDLERQRLAVLPAGHGNCLARDLGVGSADRALAALAGGLHRRLDLMDVRIRFASGLEDRRLCASTLAVGYVTDIVTFGRQRLHALGRAAYAAAAVVVVPRSFEASVAGSPGPCRPQRYTGLVINNTMHLANFRGFPDARLDDGVLDVMEQRYGWPRQLLHNCAVLARSRAFGPARLRQAAADEFELQAARTLMADGELLQDVTRVAVRCRPRAVTCVAGPS